MTHCKESSEVWTKNKNAFLELHQTYPYNDFYSKTQELIRRKFEEDGLLRIFIDDTPPQFIESLLQYKFLPYNKLELKRLQLVDYAKVDIIINFLERSQHERLNFLALYGGKKSFRSLSSLLIFLCELLSIRSPNGAIPHPRRSRCTLWHPLTHIMTVL